MKRIIIKEVKWWNLLKSIDLYLPGKQAIGRWERSEVKMPKWEFKVSFLRVSSAGQRQWVGICSCRPVAEPLISSSRVWRCTRRTIA